jgi:hypothetical protein
LRQLPHPLTIGAQCSQQESRMFRHTLLALAGLAFAATAASAIPPGIELTKDHRKAIALTPPSSVVHNLPGKAGLTKIFDNIGGKYPEGTYWCCTGNTMAGSNGMPGFEEWWLGTAFTPSADSTVTRIEVVASYISGPANLTLSIASDSNGVPGTVIESWVIKNLPKFGSCCTVTVQDDKTGIPVTAGTQYWITLTTDAKEKDTWATWEYNDTDQVDSAPTAYYCSDDNGGYCVNNDVWTAVSGGYTPALAFAVFGK